MAHLGVVHRLRLRGGLSAGCFSAAFSVRLVLAGAFFFGAGLDAFFCGIGMAMPGMWSCCAIAGAAESSVPVPSKSEIRLSGQSSNSLAPPE